MIQLRLTTTEPHGMFSMSEEPLTLPNNVGELIHDYIRGKGAYLHGEAEMLAGFDIPTFIDGNLGQLELPIEQQDILLLLPSGEYKCKSEYHNSVGSSNCYFITLITKSN